MEKFYTPDITDIRIGYELESHEWGCDEQGIPELNYDRWVPEKITASNLETIMKYGFHKAIIRVPYLTKEQIEAEGWIHKEGCLYIKGNEQEHHFYIKYPYTTLKPNPLIIMEWTPSDPNEVWSLSCRQCRFEGECKSINEFRYILKLLGI